MWSGSVSSGLIPKTDLHSGCESMSPRDMGTQRDLSFQVQVVGPTCAVSARSMSPGKGGPEVTGYTGPGH